RAVAVQAAAHVAALAPLLPALGALHAGEGPRALIGALERDLGGRHPGGALPAREHDEHLGAVARPHEAPDLSAPVAARAGHDVDGAALVGALGADRLRLGVAVALRRLGRRRSAAVRVADGLRAALPLDLLTGGDGLVAGAAGGGVLEIGRAHV